MAITSSCTQKSELEGLWIIVSAAEGDEDTHVQSSRLLLEFSNEKISFIELANHATGFFGEKIESEFDYSITSNQIRVKWEDSTIIYDYTLNDSLVLHNIGGEGKNPFLRVFKKVEPMPKLNTIPSGSYILSWPEDSTQITFLNDSLLLGFNRFGTLNWRLYSHKGAHFIIYDHAMTPISGIWSTNKTDYELRFYQKPERKVELRKLQAIDQSIFYGTWLRHKVSRKKEYNFLSNDAPPPPPELPGSTGLNIALTFTEDSLTLIHANDTISRFAQITEDGSFIYFPKRLNHSGGVWNVALISNDSLVLSRKRGQQENWYRFEE